MEQSQESNQSLAIQRNESRSYFERRSLDPLEVAFMEASGRRTLMASDADSIAQLQPEGRNQEVTEFMLDYAMRSVGATDPALTMQAAQQGEKLVRTELPASKDLDPIEKLKLQSHLMDFQGMRAFAYHQGASNHLAKDKTLSEQERGKRQTEVDALLDAKAKQDILQSTTILLDAHNEYKLLSQSKASNAYAVRGKLNGQMFEFLYATYARLNVYREQPVDPLLVVGATDFEDRCKGNYRQNHNYDVITMDVTGAPKDLVQCKNAEASEVYASPIRKVIAQSFERFTKDPSQFITAIRQLAENDINVSSDQMEQYQESLDSLFKFEGVDNKTTTQEVGRQVVAASQNVSS